MHLFDGPSEVELGPGAFVLRQFATAEDRALMSALEDVLVKSPFRHMFTPGGFRMSVAMTNCGSLGWVSDRAGYRYDIIDPLSGLPWPKMPDSFVNLAEGAARRAGYARYVPDACLINRYELGARLTLHQDRNERDFDQPIVSVSLGLPAVFLFGGLKREEKINRVNLTHGDVVVWGGPARLRYHGVMPVKEGMHPLVGPHRINLTFRKAG
jgi:alkylated DNA repair protein (DNA oxidative demethylase)